MLRCKRLFIAVSLLLLLTACGHPIDEVYVYLEGDLALVTHTPLPSATDTPNSRD